MRDKDTRLLEEALADVFREKEDHRGHGHDCEEVHPDMTHDEWKGKEEVEEASLRPGQEDQWDLADDDVEIDDPREGHDAHDYPVGDEEDRYQADGQRRESLSILKNVENWINTASGEELALGHQALGKLYDQVGQLAERGVESSPGHDFTDDELHDEPLRGETDEERYGYPGDR